MPEYGFILNAALNPAQITDKELEYLFDKFGSNPSVEILKQVADEYFGMRNRQLLDQIRRERDFNLFLNEENQRNRTIIGFFKECLNAPEQKEMVEKIRQLLNKSDKKAEQALLEKLKIANNEQ